MKSSIKYLLVLLTLGVVPSIATPPALACTYPDRPTPASSQGRIYQNDVLGFSLDIPENYRTVASQNGSISIVDPATFNFVQCAARTGEIHSVTWDYSVISIFPSAVNGNVRTLREVMRSEASWAFQTELKFYRQNGRELAVSLYRDEVESGLDGSPAFNLQIYFLSPDSRQLVRLNGAAENEVVIQSLSSLQLF